MQNPQTPRQKLDCIEELKASWAWNEVVLSELARLKIKGLTAALDLSTSDAMRNSGAGAVNILTELLESIDQRQRQYNSESKAPKKG